MSMFECQGQESAIERLQRTLKARRIPHSYIFHGPEGIGKKILARQWAACLLCESPIKRPYPKNNGYDGTAELEEIEDCCDGCHDCRLVQADTHPDLHLINRDLARFTDKGRNSQMLTLPIDVIREFVIKPAGFSPNRGKCRVFLVDQAETMNRAAQNALLKTLEEPPENTFLILITAKLDLLLPTVRSRCQSVRFHALSSYFVYEQLLNHGIPDDQARYWADFSDGRLGPALELARMELYDKKCHLYEQLSRLGYHGALELAEWTLKESKLFSKKYLDAHPGHSASDATRLGQSYYLQMITHAFRQALRWSVYPSCDDGMAPDQPDCINQMATKFSPDTCAQAIRYTSRCENLLYTNTNASLLFESLMIQLIDYANN
ncbi:MAG: DNA polymerase III subunit [Sedimentisphaerales bacterium]|nr:DNA polymerase III subunit [Sedimentisphaerales bacterium]